jgi:GT2 family glycosyltransferase
MSFGVDIIVPTYRRYRELPEFFKRNEKLQFRNATIWVVDDFSPDFDRTAIPNWGNLFLIRLEKNSGQANARNIALTRGKNPFVISLDDDAWFEDVSTGMAELERLFSGYPQAGCIMFNIATPSSDYSDIKTGTRLALHVTCGCAYRRNVLEEIQGFSGFLHSQAEETDLSLRIYQAGYDIIFAQDIKVFHNFNPSFRSLSWYYMVRFNTTRNDLLIVVMRYPTLAVPAHLIGKFLSHLIFAITYGVSVVPSFYHTGLAFFGFLRLLPKAIANRNPLTLSQFSAWRKMIKKTNQQ